MMISFFTHFTIFFAIFRNEMGALLTFRNQWAILLLTGHRPFIHGRKCIGHMYLPDRIDWKIITLLNKDGRMSSAEIARQLGDVSARTVTNRIDALTEQGFIRIRSIVNPELVGFGVLADVFVEVEPGRVRNVAEHLADLPQISYVACATGDIDIIVSIRARDIQELYDFVIETLGKIPGVRHTHTIPLALKLKSMATWMPPGVLDDGEWNATDDVPHDQGE
jgi:Lrp/AsnC family transcriptional regulator for asnA, asnC and gidA